jgi:hypothetical protein
MPPVAILPDTPSCLAVMRHALEPKRQKLIVYVVDVASCIDRPFGEATFARREDAERFVAELRTIEPELAEKLRIEERELDAGSLN